MIWLCLTQGVGSAAPRLLARSNYMYADALSWAPVEIVEYFPVVVKMIFTLLGATALLATYANRIILVYSVHTSNLSAKISDRDLNQDQ